MEFIVFKILLRFADRMGERPLAETVRKLFKIFLVGIGEVVVFAGLLCL